MSRNKSFSAFLREIGDSTKSSGMSSMGSIVRLTWLRMPIKRSKFSLSWNAFWFQARERNHGPWSTDRKPNLYDRSEKRSLKISTWNHSSVHITERGPESLKDCKDLKNVFDKCLQISYKFFWNLPHLRKQNTKTSSLQIVKIFFHWIWHTSPYKCETVTYSI